MMRLVKTEGWRQFSSGREVYVGGKQRGMMPGGRITEQVRSLARLTKITGESCRQRYRNGSGITSEADERGRA